MATHKIILTTKAEEEAEEMKFAMRYFIKNGIKLFFQIAPFFLIPICIMIILSSNNPYNIKVGAGAILFFAVIWMIFVFKKLRKYGWIILAVLFLIVAMQGLFQGDKMYTPGCFIISAIIFFFIIRRYLKKGRKV